MRKPITKRETEALQDKNAMVRMIDIRSAEEYEKLHIPGIINIPAEKLKEESAAFAKDDTIVCICNHGKERSQQAAEMLYNAGFENTFYLGGETSGWFA